jgi:hypothetical protein
MKNKINRNPIISKQVLFITFEFQDLNINGLTFLNLLTELSNLAFFDQIVS